MKILIKYIKPSSKHFLQVDFRKPTTIEAVAIQGSYHFALRKNDSLSLIEMVAFSELEQNKGNFRVSPLISVLYR